MSEPKKTGHQLVAEQLLAVLLAEVAGPGGVEAIHAGIANHLHSIANSNGMEAESKQRVLSEGLASLDVICSLAALIRGRSAPP